MRDGTHPAHRHRPGDAPGRRRDRDGYATGEIHLIEKGSTGGGPKAWIMRAPLPNTSSHVGLAMTRDGAVEVTACLGGFPPTGSPAQLAVRTAAGRIERFGPVVVDQASPRSGCQSRRLTNPREAARFLDAAFENGALVSNGYTSFRNRVTSAHNREVRAPCAVAEPEARKSGSPRGGTFAPFWNPGPGPGPDGVLETESQAIRALSWCSGQASIH